MSCYICLASTSLDLPGTTGPSFLFIPRQSSGLIGGDARSAIAILANNCIYFTSASDSSNYLLAFFRSPLQLLLLMTSIDTMERWAHTHTQATSLDTTGHEQQWLLHSRCSLPFHFLSRPVPIHLSRISLKKATIKITRKEQRPSITRSRLLREPSHKGSLFCDHSD